MRQFFIGHKINFCYLEACRRLGKGVGRKSLEFWRSDELHQDNASIYLALGLVTLAEKYIWHFFDPHTRLIWCLLTLFISQSQPDRGSTWDKVEYCIVSRWIYKRISPGWNLVLLNFFFHPKRGATRELSTELIASCTADVSACKTQSRRAVMKCRKSCQSSRTVNAVGINCHEQYIIWVIA